MKISGLDKLEKQLKELEKAMEELNGELGQVQFDVNDPSSIEDAIQHSHTLIEDKIGQYSSNPMVNSIIEQAKESFREQILDKAANHRLEGDGEN